MANKTDEVFVANGTKNVGRLATVLIGAGSAGKGAFFAAMVQIIENAFDAGADWVNIIVKKGETLMFIDNGHGFMKEDVTGFYNLLFSGKEGREDLIGKNGSGRIFLLQVAGEIGVISVSEDFPKAVTFSLNRGDVEELIAKEKIERTTKAVNLPDWWNLLGTGSAICLKDVHWSSIPSEAEIISRAGSFLLPSLARMVSVNGTPLKPRVIEGEAVHEKIKVDYLPGVQEIELYIPQVRTKLDTIRLGALNYICSLGDMVSQLGPEESQDVPSELLAGTVCGGILMPVLKEYRDHDGRSLMESFFEKDIRFSIIRFLVEEVAPRINSAFERKRQVEEKERHAKLFSEICGSFNDAFDLKEGDIEVLVSGDGVGGTKERPPVNVTPAQVVLMPGQSQTFQVRRTHGEFQWDASKSGGTTSAKSGRQVVYTAGKKVGRFDLVIRDRGDAEKARSVRIQIVDDKRLAITPIRIDVVAGEDQEFKLLNHDVTSGDIQWELKGSVKGLTLSKEDGLRIIVQTSKSTLCGDYTLRAFDRKDLAQSVEATFLVVEPDNDGDIFKIEDQVYALDAATAPIQCIVSREKKTRINTSRKGGLVIDVLRIDVEHEFLKDVRRVTSSGEALMQALLPHLVYTHLKGRVEDKLEDEKVLLHDRQTQILRQIMAARVAASKRGKKEGEE